MYLPKRNIFPLVLRHCIYCELNFNFLLNKFSEKCRLDEVFIDFLDFRSIYVLISLFPPALARWPFSYLLAEIT